MYLHTHVVTSMSVLANVPWYVTVRACTTPYRFVLLFPTLRIRLVLVRGSPHCLSIHPFTIHPSGWGSIIATSPPPAARSPSIQSQSNGGVYQLTFHSSCLHDTFVPTLIRNLLLLWRHAEKCVLGCFDRKPKCVWRGLVLARWPARERTGRSNFAFLHSDAN
jgi:hypothetical protein